MARQRPLKLCPGKRAGQARATGRDLYNVMRGVVDPAVERFDTTLFL